KPHPAWTAGSKHRIFLQISFFQSLQEFTSLFHNGQVRAEIGVENIVKSNLPESSYQSLNRCELPGQAKGFPPGSPDRRGKLNDCDLLRICQSIQDSAPVIPFS